MLDLPADSPYRQTEAKSLTSEIIALWRRAKASEKAPAAEAHNRAA